MILFSRRAAGGLAAVVGFVLAMSAPSLAQSQNQQEDMIRDSRQLVQSLRTGGYNIVVIAPTRRRSEQASRTSRKQST